HLEQYGTPAAILGNPATDFVADFVGADRGLKRLSLTRLDELPLQPLDGARGPALAGSTTLRDALSTMLSEGSRVVVVLDGDGAPRGSITLDALAERLES
ncbi:MAG: CBS domain-containing protein, partial [Gaiella sp.]